MFGQILLLSVRARWVVLFVTLVVAILGAWQVTKLPIDAVPDITNKQVQINTLTPSLSPLEVERRVTFPIETALSGIPGLQRTRSISRNGFSQVTAVFEENVDLYFARQQVAERLGQARESLPQGAEPQMGPVSTGLGEVFMYSVQFAHPGGRGARIVDGQPGWQSDGSFLTPEGERLTDAMAQTGYLRTVQDWIIRPQLRSVTGVAGIDSIGGYEKHYVVEPDVVRMSSYGISFAQLAESLERANLSVGANYVQRAGEAYLVRADARIRTKDEIAETVIASRNGVPIAVRDVATVRVGGDLRTGAASRNGQEVVIGTALMLTGENSRTVARAVSLRLDEVKRSLPPGVVATTAYDRSVLVNATIATVQRNLLEGALLVAASLFLLLGNVRAAIIATLIIPFSMLMTAIGMNTLGVSGNLMSLGALDFGLIVDGTVIVIENSLRRLAERQHREGRLLTLEERHAETIEAGREMIRPTVYGQAIIFLVFVPLLTFTGVEGKMFSPMAITLMLALAAAFILSLTFVPAMVAILVRGKVAEKEVRALQWFKRVYEPRLRDTVSHPWRYVFGGLAVFAVSGMVFMTLGREFIPQLDEKDVAMQAIRIPSTSLDQSVAMQMALERAISTLPEVAMVFSKTGTAEVATDPMPPNASDSFIMLRPQSEWPAGVRTKADVLRRIEERIASTVGNNYELTQPIQMRFNELIAGVRGDVAVQIYGDDLDKMGATAAQVARVLQGVPGVADLRVEQTAGFPTLDLKFNRTAIARYGLTIDEVAETVAVALGGQDAGLVFEGDRRFDIVVRLPLAQRNDLAALGALPVMLPETDGSPSHSIPLRELATFSFSEGLNQVSRDGGSRRIVVQANVRGRDLGSFVAEAQAAVAREVTLPTGSYLRWGGQFENLQAAAQRLGLIVPVCFVLIFAILFMALGGARPATAVFSAVPMALAGGVFTLALTGIPLSISAAVGFICLAGVAVLNGLVVMTSIRQQLDNGLPLSEAIVKGVMERVRPVIMTGLVPAIGFIPMAVAHGTGAEVQKPLATVVIGGLITATVLTLFVLPAISKLILRISPPIPNRMNSHLPAEAPIPPTAATS
ncbi:MAG: CusA/CzcA family heavy metal efflux RND transporter [Caulobacteraceae bacterium]